MTALTDDKILQNQSQDIEAKISEIGALEDVGADIPISPEKIAKIKEKDPDAKFIIAEIESGWSNSKREWPPEVVEGIVRQVNEKRPVAYLGHIPANLDDTEFPPVQAIWLGAAVKRVGEKVIARVKGYLLPKSEVREREYVEHEAINSVSVRGDSTLSPTRGGWRVKKFTLESIDFARKNRGGMPGRIAAITTEMEGGSKVEPKDITALDESELRTHAPLLVAEIERKVTEPLTVKISEMETSVAALEPEKLTVASIREKLGLDEKADPIQAVVDLLERVEESAKAEIKELVNKAVEKVAGKSGVAQKLVHRLIGEQIVTEFQDKEADEEKIENRVQEIVDGDEEVKAVISEMSGVSGEERRRDNTGGASFGTKSKGTEDKPKSRTGKLNYSKRRVSV
jgi:hypothetical protein